MTSYLDNAATTKPDPEVLEALLPYLGTDWHNPSSGYQAARKVKKAVEEAREKVAASIGAHPEEIIFTSGGTESNSLALYSADYFFDKEAPFLTSPLEHSAVLKPFEDFAQRGRPVLFPKVTAGGRIETTALPTETPCSFASLMWVNNEVGVIQPVEDFLAWAQKQGVTTHCDAVQAFGKLEISVRSAPFDFLSLSAHKFHGIKGAGALYVRSGMRVHPLLRGGGQEQNLRSGTENVAAIIGMGEAAQRASEALSQLSSIRKLRDLFESLLAGQLPDVIFNGDPQHRIAHHSHLSVPGCEAAGLLILLDQYGVECSAGSACMTGKQHPSHVQKAMGLSDEIAKSSLRFSLSKTSTEEEIRHAVASLKKAVTKLRSVQTGGIGPVVVYNP